MTGRQIKAGSVKERRWLVINFYCCLLNSCLCNLIYLSWHLIIIIDIFRTVYFFCQQNFHLLWYFIDYSNIRVTCYDAFIRISYTLSSLTLKCTSPNLNACYSFFSSVVVAFLLLFSPSTWHEITETPCSGEYCLRDMTPFYLVDVNHAFNRSCCLHLHSSCMHLYQLGCRSVNRSYLQAHLHK